MVVILGLGYSKRKKIKNMVEKMNGCGFNIKIVERSDNISEYVKGCDFAITSNGRTVFEIAAMKIPMIAISINKREQQHSFVRYSKSGYHIDMYPMRRNEIVFKKIKAMMDYGIRKKFIKNLERVDLLNGVNRVLTLIEAGYKRKMTAIRTA